MDTCFLSYEKRISAALDENEKKKTPTLNHLILHIHIYIYSVISQKDVGYLFFRQICSTL